MRHLDKIADFHDEARRRGGESNRFLVNVETKELRYLLHLDRLPCDSAPRLGYSAQRNPRRQEVRSTHPV